MIVSCIYCKKEGKFTDFSPIWKWPEPDAKPNFMCKDCKNARIKEGEIMVYNCKNYTNDYESPTTDLEMNMNCLDYSPTEEIVKLREQKKVLQEVFPDLENPCEFLRALEKFSSNTSYDKDLLTPALELHRSILRHIGEMIYDFYSALSDKEEIIEDVRTSDIVAQRIIKGEKTISHEEIKQKLGM